MKIKISKWLCILLCALLLCAAPMTVFAAELDENNTSDSAVISAEVPSAYTLTVNTDGAAVYADNVKVEGGTAEFNRQSTPKLLISAESGRKIVSVTLNGKDITAELKNGMYMLPNVITNQMLTVITAEETVPDEATYTVAGTVKQEDGKPVSGITLELRSELKTLVTGSDGTFRFEKVESGHHSLTALHDGKVVGYTEFILNGSSVELNYTVAGDGTVNINVPDKTAAVNLDLKLTDDGILQIADVQTTKADGDGMIWLWLALPVILCGVLITLVVIRRKRRKSHT